MALTLGVSGCGTAIQNNEELIERTITTADEDVTGDEDVTVQEEVPVMIEQPTEEGPVEFEELSIKGAEVKYTEFTKEYNAESGTIQGSAEVKDERDDFRGTGYVTNILTESDWELHFDLPETQYYNIVLTAASDEAYKNGISVNDVKISEFTTTGSGKFENFTFKNIKLEAGINKISIVPKNGIIDIDCVNVTASDEIQKLDFTLKNAALSNEDSDYGTQALYQYLCSQFGKKVILGQYDTTGTNYECGLIYDTTGKEPAIRFGDLMPVTFGADREEEVAEEIETAVQWHDKGGIVGYMWNWTSPLDSKNGESIYADSTEFDLKKAMTDEDIAEMDIGEIRTLYEDGDISAECYALCVDIDSAAKQLKVLQDNGITVLWRPLHEASNGYFWWGRDEDSYKWLWKLMYDRMTNYHGLNNLIWVWSAQNANWYVGTKYCDILSVDFYSSDGDKTGQVNSLLYLQSIADNKPIAMSECGCFPKIQSIADEKAMWSYIGQWGGNFLVDENGELSEENITNAELITMYNNDLTITLDKLPDFEKLAAEVEKEALEKAEKEKEEKESSEDEDGEDTDSDTDGGEDTDNGDNDGGDDTGDGEGEDTGDGEDIGDIEEVYY